MTDVDLNQIGNDQVHRWNAIYWLIKTYGPADDGNWRLRGLNLISFKEPKHATHFILRWS
jgi:hypothetical protein